MKKNKKKEGKQKKAKTNKEEETWSEETGGTDGISHYLVRVKNVCGETAGADSDGTPRSSGACPGIP